MRSVNVYGKRPPYTKFITYPHALHHLELLQQSSFRQALKHQDVVQALHRQQYYVWANW